MIYDSDDIEYTPNGDQLHKYSEGWHLSPVTSRGGVIKRFFTLFIAMFGLSFVYGVKVVDVFILLIIFYLNNE